jgi:hypothetical protein
MKIIELYKDKPNTLWQNNETFLCVFNENNILVGSYDFNTGLKLMQDDKEMTIFIHDDDLISGKWVLFATKVNNDYIKKYTKKMIKVDGFKAGKETEIKFQEQYPWNKNWGHGKYVSREEREKRLSVCSKCPFFNLDNISCSINKKIVLESTKYHNEYCPEKKWGDKDAVMKEIFDEATLRGDIIISQNHKIDIKEQEDFEAELEKYLKGK